MRVRNQELVVKSELDGRVAELLGKKLRAVSHVTEAFLHEIVRALVESGEVRLDGLGTLHVNCRQGTREVEAVLTNGHGHKKGAKARVRVLVTRKYYVNFRRSSRLREALWARYGKQKQKEIPMDKFGVDESVDGEDLEKKASEGCPKCGAKVTRHGSTLICPKCGSEPFEQKK